MVLRINALIDPKCDAVDSHRWTCTFRLPPIPPAGRHPGRSLIVVDAGRGLVQLRTTHLLVADGGKLTVPQQMMLQPHGDGFGFGFGFWFYCEQVGR